MNNKTTLYILVYYSKSLERSEPLGFTEWEDAMHYYEKTNGTAIAATYFNGKNFEKFDPDADLREYRKKLCELRGFYV